MFDTLEHGYHAALVLLCEDHRKGYNTVRKIINHWATETEKDIKAYISAVMGELSGLVDDDGYLPESSDSRITNLDALSRICFAMSQFECGYQEVDDAGGYEALFDDALPHFKYPSIK